MSESYKDADILRIKKKIEWFNNIFKHGTINMLINLLVSYLVTLEITNGIEKITIQDIYNIFKSRVDEMNKIFDELCFFVDTVNDIEKIQYEKNQFRIKLYKLFDLGDLINTLINKSVTMASRIKKVTNPLLDTQFKPLTITMIDTLFLTDTDVEFENKLYEYINERVESVDNHLKRKMIKIKLVHNILKKIIDEPIITNDQLSDMSEHEMIEMSTLKS